MFCNERERSEEIQVSFDPNKTSTRRTQNDLSRITKRRLEDAKNRPERNEGLQSPLSTRLPCDCTVESLDLVTYTL